MQTCRSSIMLLISSCSDPQMTAPQHKLLKKRPAPCAGHQLPSKWAILRDMAASPSHQLAAMDDRQPAQFSCPAQVPGGWAAQRYGGRVTLIVSFLLWSTGSLLTPRSAHSTRGITAARVLVGIAQGGIIPSIHTVLSQANLPAGRLLWQPPFAISLALWRYMPTAKMCASCLDDVEGR